MTTSRGRVDPQGKSFRRTNGQLGWRKPGDVAREFEASAVQKGAAGAPFILTHIIEPGVQQIDIQNQKMTIEAPSSSRLYAATAVQCADKVAFERAEYGKRKRQRTDKHGKAGDSLSPKNLQYPTSADDFEPFDSFVAGLTGPRDPDSVRR